MERVLETPGLGDIIFKGLSMTDLANLRVTRNLRTIVSHHAGELMESYDRSLKKRCDRIFEGSDNDAVGRSQPRSEKCIYSTPYKCVYTYFHTLVKLSFICPDKKVFLDEVITYLQTLKRVAWGYEYILIDGYYRAQSFTAIKSFYDIVSYIHMNPYGRGYNMVNDIPVNKYLKNKLLPVTIE